MRLIILDRDGVINHDSADYIKSAKEWRPIDGSLEAIARLNHGGWRAIVATNQSGLGRGLFDYGDLFAMHDKLKHMLTEVGGHLDGIVFCPHTPDDDCDCRKPKPGMLRDIAHRLQIDLKQVPVVGDGLRDIQAARAADAQPILVRTGNGAQTEAECEGVAVYDDLGAVADALIEREAS